MSADLEWERDGRAWPNREASHFVNARSLRWHVQRMGSGPALLLVHGTGASTHSWRALAPLLAASFTVIAPDLPGHGFTAAPSRGELSLPGMTHALATLLETLDLRPQVAVGHSAGAAILVHMSLQGLIAPRAIVSLNGALQPFRGLAKQLFPPLARLLVLNPLVPKLFTWGAGSRTSVERLIRDTGSKLDEEGIALYARLLRNPQHVASALGMMASWDLSALDESLPRLRTPLMLVVGGNDRSVAPDDAFRVRDRVPGATVEYLRGLGHLAHEEAPARIAQLIVTCARKVEVLS